MKFEFEERSVHIGTGGRAHKDSASFVVFLHGSGQNHLTWGLQSRYFAYEGYNIIAPDFPGHGLSGGSPLTSIEDMADGHLLEFCCPELRCVCRQPPSSAIRKVVLSLLRWPAGIAHMLKGCA